jgi:hypothetical protein
VTRIQRYKLLQIFGDGKPHNWFEVIFFGVQFLKVRQSFFEKLFTRALEYGLLVRLGQASNTKDDNYQITAKGDECLRGEQMSRAGDPSYYKYFDRSIDGAFGLNHYAPLAKGLKKSDNG